MQPPHEGPDGRERPGSWDWAAETRGDIGFLCSSSEAAAVGVAWVDHLVGLHLNTLVVFIFALGELIQKVQLLWKTWKIWPHWAGIPKGSLDHS